MKKLSFWQKINVLQPPTQSLPLEGGGQGGGEKKLSKFITIIKEELSGFGKYERIIFPSVILLIFIISFLTGDSKIALINAVCGISYTILAGKGRILCYYIGITGSLCYIYLAFMNNFYGNLALYALYYIPMEVIGIFKWQKHLEKDKREIQKTCLTNKEQILYGIITVVCSIILTIVLYYTGGKNPAIDALTTVLSVLGLLLTVKRCIEQWYIWFIVNFLSFVMWLNAYINGSNCLATVLMWFVYWILSVYFLVQWKKQMN